MSPFPAARPRPPRSCRAFSPRSAPASAARAMELSLAFIGWFFTLICAGALALGAALMAIMARAGDLERRYLSYSVWNDLVLAAIWVLGLAGGIGVLRLEPWGRYLVELFCWALIVLLLLSAASRLYALKQPNPGAPPVNWLGAIGGGEPGPIPLLAVCAAAHLDVRQPRAIGEVSRS